MRAGDALPKVALVITAHNEADVIAEKLENALALDYPRELLRIVVTSDASSDGTDDIVRSFADRGVELVVAKRGGKVNAQNTAMRALGDAIDVVAFSDANSTWSPDALRRLVRPFADPDVAYVCGRLALRSADGTNQEGAYWRLEVSLRAAGVGDAARSPAATARSTPCAARTTPWSTRAGATTSRSRT